MNPSWYGKCINASDNLTLDKVYKVEEDTTSKANMRGVFVIDDDGNRVCMFAARFEKVNKPKKPVNELVNDPKYITVHTSDRYLRGQTGRVISKKVLRNAVEKNCYLYQQGKCNECLTIPAEAEQEIDCMSAWKLTTGKGKKLY
jgi:hypothetical protein